MENRMDHYLSDRVVVITGGSSGFGLETARILLGLNAKVVITGRNKKRLDDAEKDLQNEKLLAVQADAAETKGWKRLFAKTVERFKRIDVLVNNHGAGVKVAPTEEMDDDSILEIININLTSVIKGCREVIQVMKAQRRGHIVNVSSGCAHHSWPSWGVYTAAKAGIVGFTRCLHLEMSEWGGKATSFIPGAARTGFCDAAGIDSSRQDGYPGSHEFARTIVHCIDVPENTVVEEVNIWGTKQISDMLNPF